MADLSVCGWSTEHGDVFVGTPTTSMRTLVIPETNQYHVLYFTLRNELAKITTINKAKSFATVSLHVGLATTPQ